MTKTLALVIVSLLLGGCVHYLQYVFDKGTLGASLSLAGASVQKSIHLPPGDDVRAVFAIRDYVCRPPDPSTTVSFKLVGEQGVVLESSFRLRDLTWTHGLRSCHAHGYLYDPVAGLGPRFKIPGYSPREFQLTVSVSDGRPTSRDAVDVWFIYNGMAPKLKMFGPE